MIAPSEVYPNDPLPDLRDLISLDPYLIDASPEAIADRLDLDPWVVETALEALTVEGEVRA